jgi:LysR family glycine cleavage system transcriptional activator
VEKFLDEWMIPVAHPELIRKFGLLERDSDPERFPLLESDDEPWRVWWQPAAQREWQTRPPAIDDSAGLLAAAEEGLGYAIMRWTLVARSLQKGTLKVAGKEILPYSSSYFFVCPARYLEMPKVAQFRDWLFEVAREFPKPPKPLQKPS